jgi:hypothetical protein
MSLRDFLMAVLGGSFAIGPIVYGAFEYFNALQDMQPKYKRLLVAALSGLLGLAAWGLAVALGYQPAPGATSGWAEAAWQYGILTGFAAFMSASLIHGNAKL